VPIPTLHIDDEAVGQPRQPVALRLARLVTGLTCADFGYLLAEIQAGGQPYLSAYEYRPGDAPRLVPADHYRSSLPNPGVCQGSCRFNCSLNFDLIVSPTRLRGRLDLGGAWIGAYCREVGRSLRLRPVSLRRAPGQGRSSSLRCGRSTLTWRAAAGA
jgi:hypothetical protein